MSFYKATEQDIIVALDQNRWRHSRAVIKDIEKRLGEKILIGCFYISVDSLERQGIIEVEDTENGILLKLVSSKGGETSWNDTLPQAA